eukprot:4359824-Prorocentrum_lima.AAC.1
MKSGHCLHPEGSPSFGAAVRCSPSTPQKDYEQTWRQLKELLTYSCWTLLRKRTISKGLLIMCGNLL